MIQKTYRLKEKEVKKVLAKGKPFFSYMVVLNSIPNNYAYHRFGIVLSQKSLKNSVTRNFFRRKFYNLLRLHWFITSRKQHDTIENIQHFDFVCVVKKHIKLDKTEALTREDFEKNIYFLFSKALKIWKKYSI